MNKVELFLQDSSGVNLVDPVQLTQAIPKDGISIDDEKLSGIDNFIVEARRAQVNVRLLKHNPSFNNSLKTLLTDKSRLISDSINTTSKLCLMLRHEDVLDEFSTDRLFYRNANDMTQTWDAGNTDEQLIVQSIRMYRMFYKILHNIRANTGGPGADNSSFNKLTAMFYKIIQNFAETTTPSAQDFADFINDRCPFLSVDDDDLLTTSLMQFLSKTEYKEYMYLLSHSIYDLIGGAGNEILFYDNESDTEYNSSIIEQQEMTVTGWAFAAIFNISCFLASIIKYNDYNDLVESYYANGQNPQRLNRVNSVDGHTSRTIYTPFYDMKEIVVGMNPNPEALIPINNLFKRLLLPRYVTFCNQHQPLGVQIGKTQRKTPTSDNPDITYVDTENESLYSHSSIIPVERYYMLESSTYMSIARPMKISFYFDNFKRNEIFKNISSNCYLCTYGDGDTDWMYSDSIKCYERILAENESVFVDNIPIYDAENGDETDNFGLYIYRDFFDKYYVKNKSNIMNIYGTITVDGVPVYKGLIDFDSVSSSRNNLSFDMTDSIGIMTDNISKLESLVEFSQFNTEQDETIANLLAGTSLRWFATAMIFYPFPYNHALNNPLFDIGTNPGLENKILNEISAETGFINAIQCSKSLIYVNQDGVPDITGNILTDGNVATIDGEILSIETSQRVSSETFNIDNLKNIAGFNQFVPDIVKFYMQIRNNYSVEKNIEIYGQTSEINLLDRITIDDKTYIVINKGIDLRNKIMKITAIGSA